ncbi:MAG: sulfotransferase [Pseudomonadota bacterium]
MMSTPGLEPLVAELGRYPGPFGIVARPHSGTRLLAEALLINGVYLGATVSKGYLDSHDWYRFFTVPLLGNRSFCPDSQLTLPAAGDRFVERCLVKALEHYLGHRRYDPGHAVIDPVRPLGPGGWGWKMSEMVLLLPTVRRFFPDARIIHLIRDGRDVTLSDNGFFQLTNRNTGQLAEDHRRFLRRSTFGDDDRQAWRGIDLDDADAIHRNRFLLQMKSWMTCVSAGRSFGRAAPDSYLEVRYEDLCTQPQVEAGRAFEFLGIEMVDETREFLAKAPRRTAIGKWHEWPFTPEERADFDAAVTLGTPLLTELGYR